MDGPAALGSPNTTLTRRAERSCIASGACEAPGWTTLGLSLRKRPFSPTADSDVFYPSASHQRACARLLAAVKAPSGLITPTGGSGTGKTTVLHRVARDLAGAGCGCSGETSPVPRGHGCVAAPTTECCRLGNTGLLRGAGGSH